MHRYRFGRRDRYGERQARRPRSRAVGCLLWSAVAIVVLIVLSLMFGGFQKGTKAGGLALVPYL
jgi:cytochrome c-type biogenesis protein CcmH/NrfF